MDQACFSAGNIGGADGPTAVFVSDGASCLMAAFSGIMMMIYALLFGSNF